MLLHKINHQVCSMHLQKLACPLESRIRTCADIEVLFPAIVTRIHCGKHQQQGRDSSTPATHRICTTRSFSNVYGH